MDSDCTGGRTAMQFDTASQNNLLFKKKVQGYMSKLMSVTCPLTSDAT